MKAQEWAERVGREAVALGMPWRVGMLLRGPGLFIGSARIWWKPAGPHLVIGDGGNTWPITMHGPYWPDFRDRLTELACIAWVEDVAREVYGALAELDFQIGGPASRSKYRVTVAKGGTNVSDWRLCVDERAPTLAEACIAAVRAMREADND